MTGLWQYFHPVLPHLTTEDTVYDGHLIPKGSMLLANIKYEKPFTSEPTLSHPLPPRFMLRDERFWDNSIRQNLGQKSSYKN